MRGRRLPAATSTVMVRPSGRRTPGTRIALPAGRVRRLAARAAVAIALGMSLPGCGELYGQVVDTTFTADSTATVSPLAADTLAADTPPDVPYAGPLPQEAATQVGYITRAYPEAPGGTGLIDAGTAEARIAMEHVALAGRDPTDLSSMSRHMAHVLHAIDPAEVGTGPGMGYGVKRAAQAVASHAEQLAAMQEVPGVLAFHAPHAARAARGAIVQADEAIELARQVQRATSATTARRALRRLADVVRWMAYGGDRDEDGRIGHSEGESGLAQARYHLSLVERLTR